MLIALKKYITGMSARAQKGQIIVFTAALLPLLIAATGFTVDFGNMYMHKSRLQNAADAAAIAGGHSYHENNEKLNDHPKANEAANKSLELNHPQSDKLTIGYKARSDANGNTNVTDRDSQPEEIDIAKDVVELYENKIERDTRVNPNKNNDLKSVQDIEQDIASEDTDGVTNLKTESKEIKKDDKAKTQSKDIESNEESNQEQSSIQSKQETKISKPETKSENNNSDSKTSEIKDEVKSEQISNSNVEQEVNQEFSNTPQNDLLNSIAEKNSDIENKTKELLNDTSIPWSKKSLDTIKNYIFNLSKKLSTNETKSSFVNNSTLEIKKDINSFLEYTKLKQKD